MYSGNDIQTDKVIFDISNQTIIRSEKLIQLSTKAFALLNYFCKHPNVLLTKQQLLDEIWHDSFTVEAVIKNVISELRKALNDNTKSPIFIQTIHRRGYRYIGEDNLFVTKSIEHNYKDNKIHLKKFKPTISNFIGRKRQLTTISNAWQSALDGKFVCINIKGDPGVGKSTLLQTWISQYTQIDNRQKLIIQSECKASTQKLSYLTLFDGLDQVFQSSHSQLAGKLLAKHCPNLFNSVNHSNKLYSTLRNSVLSKTQPQTSGELFFQITGFIRSLTEQIPIIWSIDDIHYCDEESRSFLNFSGLQQSVTHFMMILTECDWHTPGESLGLTMEQSKSCNPSFQETIDLPFFAQSEVNELISATLNLKHNQKQISNHIFNLTDGHPLITKEMISLQNSGLTVDLYTQTVKKRMQIELTKLTPEYFQLLQAASVVVVNEFSAAAIASLLNISIIQAEDYCEQLALNTGWIKRSTSRTWPDGTIAQLYKFSHLVYRDYIYQMLPAAHKQSMHLQHAKRLETAYEDDINSIASNLLYHFQRSSCKKHIQRYKKILIQSKNSTTPEDCGLKPFYHQPIYTDEVCAQARVIVPFSSQA